MLNFLILITCCGSVTEYPYSLEINTDVFRSRVPDIWNFSQIVQREKEGMMEEWDEKLIGNS